MQDTGFTIQDVILLSCILHHVSCILHRDFLAGSGGGVVCRVVKSGSLAVEADRLATRTSVPDRGLVERSEFHVGKLDCESAAGHDHRD
jgi:hypothetical protein